VQQWSYCKFAERFPLHQNLVPDLPLWPALALERFSFTQAFSKKSSSGNDKPEKQCLHPTIFCSRVTAHKSGMANDQSTPQNEVMNGDEAAIFLKMPKSTLLKLCSEGQLPGVKVGRQWRFNRFALENWMRERDGEASNLPEESVGQPVEIDFPTKLQKAESTVTRQIKPVVEEMVGSVGDDDFDSVGEVREIDEFSGVSEVNEEPEEEEAPAKPAAKATRKTTIRSASALELMAQISEKSQSKKPSKAVPAAREPKIRKAVQPSSSARPAFRETTREHSSDSDAVEISRPYNKPGAVPLPPPRGGDRSGGGMNAFRKLAYWVVILVVLGAAGFGIKELLKPGEPAPSPLAKPKPQPSLPVLPEFQAVYKHNDNEESSKENFNMPQSASPAAAPMPAAVTDAIASPSPAPIALVEAPTPKPVTLTPEVPARTAPIAPVAQVGSAPQTDQNLEAINSLLPSLMELPGCVITSNKNEIRIKFEDGIFASGVKVDKKGREQLASGILAQISHPVVLKIHKQNPIPRHAVFFGQFANQLEKEKGLSRAPGAHHSKDF
jgi:excisionase family DNA binding protein